MQNSILLSKIRMLKRRAGGKLSRVRKWEIKGQRLAAVLNGIVRASIPEKVS